MSGDDEQATPPEVASLSLADKLDRCFRTMHPADRGEWTYREASAEIGKTGIAVSPSYLWQLRKGARDNPTVRQMQAIADFFHVSITYFFGPPEEVDKLDAQLTLVRALRDRKVRDLALRASELTPAGVRAIANIIEEFQSVRGMGSRRTRSNNPDIPEQDPEIDDEDY